MRFLSVIPKNLLRRKERSALTVMGIALAVCVMTTALNVSYNFDVAFKKNFYDRKVAVVVVKGGVTDQLSSDLDEGLAEKFLEIDGVKDVQYGLNQMIDIKKQNTVVHALVTGWKKGAPQFGDMKVLDGRLLEPGDENSVMLGETLADDLGKKAGDTIIMQDQKFEVVGVFQGLTYFETGGVVLFIDRLQEMMLLEGVVTGFGIVLDDEGLTTEEREQLAYRVRDEINEFTTDSRGYPVYLAAQTTADYIDSFMPLKLATAMAEATTWIALAYGALFVLTIMIMSVMERVKEIGILRAVGWRRWRVMVMILGESILLTCAGGLIGLVLVKPVLYGLIRAVPGFRGLIDPTVSPSMLTLGFCLALLMGLISGLGPAFRASQLRPTEALRHE